MTDRLVIEMWAIVVTVKWQEGEPSAFMHDGEKPWLFPTKKAAAEKAKSCDDYRKAQGWPRAKYKPTLVRISPAPDARGR